MRVAVLEWWNPKKKFGLCFVKNPDFSIQRYFIHMSQVVKCVPNIPKTNHIVRFNPSAEKPKPGYHHAALNVEIFETREQMEHLDENSAITPEMSNVGAV